MKTAGIHTGGNHLGLLPAELSVTGILMIGLLTGAGDHQIGLGQSLLLSLDPATDRIGLFNLLTIATAGQQMLHPNGVNGGI